MLLLEQMAQHTTGSGSIQLRFQPQKELYQTAAVYLQNCLLLDDELVEQFESPADYQKAIDNDMLIELHWYDRNQTGSYVFMASNFFTLERRVRASGLIKC